MRNVVLVCGGRTFNEGDILNAELDKIHAELPITKIVHGGATGADTLAGLWAAKRGVPLAVYPAEWGRYGRAAGPLRNGQMLAKESPDIVLAVMGGRGTANMIRQSEAYGVARIIDLSTVSP